MAGTSCRLLGGSGAGYTAHPSVWLGFFFGSNQRAILAIPSVEKLAQVAELWIIVRLIE